jgi:uncharacterized protein (DUF1800 family)
MADRHLAPDPDRAGVPTAADAPLVDLIFPNREPSQPRGYDPGAGYGPDTGYRSPEHTGSMPRVGDGFPSRHRADTTGSMPRSPYDTGSMPRPSYDTGSMPRVRPDSTGSIPRVPAGTMTPGSMETLDSPRFAPTEFQTSTPAVEPPKGPVAGLTRFLRRGKPRKVRVAAGLGDHPVRRRRVLLGMGTGVVVAGGAAAAATLLTGAVGSAKSDNPLANTNLGLGAEGLAESAIDAASTAGQAKPIYPTPLGRDPELHLLRRATFGPTLVDVVAVKQMGLDAWLERQFNPASVADPTADAILATYPTIAMSTAQIRATLKDNDGMAMQQLGHATVARQMWSSRQLFEVMVDFWSNHLNVTNPSDGLWDTRTPYDNEVIRAHALGRYADMLLASARHPAMMKYLDNANSQKKSVNENYGRELLELHTVGLDAKYSEADVRNSAYIMTGRTVTRDNAFTYDKNRHWVGAVKVMDFAHPNDKNTDGMALGDQYVMYLAVHPATAKRIAFKLARRFVCDDPPQTLVDRLAQSYLDNGTAIVPVLRTLFNSVEFWMSTGLKTRRPLENLVATARIMGVEPGAKTADGVAGLYRMAENLGHAPLTWGPPDGFPDYADAWGSAHATLGNWNAHRSIVGAAQKGLTYVKAESLIGLKPDTVGAYLDVLSQRLIQQPMLADHKAALLKFLGLADNAAVKDLRLGGKIDTLVPLVLDSVYHALR